MAIRSTVAPGGALVPRVISKALRPAVIDCLQHQFEATPDSELDIRVREMTLDRSLRNEQSCADLPSTKSGEGKA